MKKTPMWVVVLSFAGGSEVIRSAPMALPEAEAHATRLNAIGGLTASLCASEPVGVRDPLVEDREDVLGWAIFTGAEGDDPSFHAFFTDLSVAGNYLLSTEVARLAALERASAIHFHGGPGLGLCDPVIVPACVMRIRVGVDDMASAARAVLEATGTAGHPRAKRFLEDAAAWDKGEEKKG